MVISDIVTDGLVSVAIVSLLMSSICTQYRDARREHLRIRGHLQVKVRGCQPGRTRGPHNGCGGRKDIRMTIEDAHIRPSRRSFLKGVGGGSTARSCSRPNWLLRYNKTPRGAARPDRVHPMAASSRPSALSEPAVVHRRFINQMEVLS
jgi:hypothetical protein